MNLPHTTTCYLVQVLTGNNWTLVSTHPYRKWARETKARLHKQDLGILHRVLKKTTTLEPVS